MVFWSGKDAVDRQVVLPRRPERIVSLVPSQTELLVDLDVGERLVGRTRYCIHPKDRLSKVAIVGGTKRVNQEQVRLLEPDLILAEKEETPKDLVDSLSGLAPVYVTDVVSIPTAVSMCEAVGQLVGLATEGHALASQIESSMKDAKGIIERPERVLYLIWKKPWMAAGNDTFIHSCLEHLGFQNAVTSHFPLGRYPELDTDSFQKLDPDRILLSSEPYPFKERHAQELLAILPRARIELVDGDLFSWYGSRMLKMPKYWRKQFATTS